VELTPSQKGAVAETAFAHHATRLGLAVARPVAEGERYDLILDLRPRLLRVQCKWGNCDGAVVTARLSTFRRVRDGGLVTTYSAAEIDAFGLYCASLDRCYVLPIDLVEGHRTIHLRLTPSGNNQTTGINWAAQYELGAIAQLGERSAGSRKVAGSSPASSTPQEPRVARLFS
jgi:hypothetical protein